MKDIPITISDLILGQKKLITSGEYAGYAFEPMKKWTIRALEERDYQSKLFKHMSERNSLEECQVYLERCEDMMILDSFSETKRCMLEKNYRYGVFCQTWTHWVELFGYLESEFQMNDKDWDLYDLWIEVLKQNSTTLKAVIGHFKNQEKKGEIITEHKENDPVAIKSEDKNQEVA